MPTEMASVGIPPAGRMAANRAAGAWVTGMRQSVHDPEEIGDGPHVQQISRDLGRGWCGRPIPARWVPSG